MVWPTEVSVTDEGVIVIRVGTGAGGGGTGVAGGGGSGTAGFVGLSLPQVVSANNARPTDIHNIRLCIRT